MPPTEPESWPADLTRRLVQMGVIPELDSTLVEIAPGVNIPRVFQRQVLLSTDGKVRATVVIRTDQDTRKPRLLEIRFHWSGGGCDLDDLTDERQRRLVEVAVTEEAATVAARRMMGDAPVAMSDQIRDLFPELPEDLAGVALLNSSELTRVEQRAQRAVRPKPGPKPVEDDRKLEALNWYREGGIPLAMERTGRAERTLRRWIADAKRIERDRDHGVR